MKAHSPSGYFKQQLFESHIHIQFLLFVFFFISISIYRLPGVCHPPYLHTHWALRDAKVNEQEKESYLINDDDVLRFNNNNNSIKMKEIFRNFCLVCLLDGLFAFSCLQFSQIDAVIYSNYAIQWSIIYNNDDKMASYRNMSGNGYISYFTCLLVSSLP